MKIRLILLLVLISGLMISCAKSGGDCISSSGEIILQQRITADFDSIYLSDNINLIITQRTADSVTVEAGKYIIDGISTEVINNTLFIKNKNSCNWIRDYSKPLNVYVTVKNLSQLMYESSGNVTSRNVIAGNKLIVDAIDGSGTIYLKVYNEYGLYSERNGTADIHIEGTTIFCSVYSSGYGPLYCENLNTDYLTVSSSGSNDCYVRCCKQLDARISSIGNVYYTGNPGMINQSITGTGKLIPF